MSTPEQVMTALAQVVGVESIWKPSAHPEWVEREEPGGRAWVHRCCDVRMRRIYIVRMRRAGLNKPANSKFARQFHSFTCWRCEVCGYEEVPSLGNP